MAYCAYCGSHVAQVSFAPCASCGRPTNGAPPAPVRQSSTAAIVIGVVAGAFVVIAVIGILAAIAIPNLITATQRSKQKRTMADMRTLAVMIESYKVDKGTYPSASNVAELQPLLAEYGKTVPQKDGWGNDIQVSISGQGYILGSGGKDGSLDRRPDEYTPATTNNFDCDIIYANDAFVQQPDFGGGQ